MTLAIAAFASLAAATSARAVTRTPDRCTQEPVPILCAIHHHHKRADILRERMGLSRIPYHWVADRRSTSNARRERILTYWVRVHQRTAARYKRWRRAQSAVPWSASWYRAAMCVHSHEGAWNDPDAPYWGGLQMDLGFQQSYGAEFYARYGTADHWPPHDQLIAAYRAWKVRGWTPWPNTAAACGLL